MAEKLQHFVINILKLTEVPLPVRFIFIYMVPDFWGNDVREVGRTMGTLLSNPVSLYCNNIVKTF